MQPEVHPALNPVILLACTALLTLLAIVYRLWRASRSNLAVRLFLLSGAVYFVIAIYAAYALKDAGIDGALHDTYYVVAHYQYALGGMLAFLALTVLYAFWQRLYQVTYHRPLAILQWGTFTAGALLSMIPQLFLSQTGLPRRYGDYSSSFERWDWLASLGYYVTLISVILFAMTLFEAIARRIRNGKEVLHADDRPNAFS